MGIAGKHRYVVLTKNKVEEKYSGGDKRRIFLCYGGNVASTAALCTYFATYVDTCNEYKYRGNAIITPIIPVPQRVRTFNLEPDNRLISAGNYPSAPKSLIVNYRIVRCRHNVEETSEIKRRKNFISIMLKLSVFFIALFSASIVRVSGFNIFGNMPNVFDLTSQIQKQVHDIIKDAEIASSTSDSDGTSSSTSFSTSSNSNSNGYSRSTSSGSNSKGVKYSRETIEWTNGTIFHRIEKISYPTLGTKKEYHYTMDLTDPEATPVLVTE